IFIQHWRILAWLGQLNGDKLSLRSIMELINPPLVRVPASWISSSRIPLSPARGLRGAIGCASACPQPSVRFFPVFLLQNPPPPREPNRSSLFLRAAVKASFKPRDLNRPRPSKWAARSDVGRRG